MTDTTPAPPSGTTPWGVLFDLDGTLVDTNYLHVHCWWEALTEAGHEASAYDVHRAIGRPSADLVRAVLGHEDEAVVAGHSRRWEQLRPRAKAFAGAADLLRACKDAGARTAWCTTGSPDDVEAFRSLLGVEPDVLVTGDDVTSGKPDPEPVRVALDRLGTSEAVMVGDTTWDVRSASAAGLPTLSLLCGGIGETELREAGCAAVAGAPADVLTDLRRLQDLARR